MVIVVILLWPSSTLSHLSSSITWLSLTCTLLSSWRILIKRIKKKRLGLWRKILRCFIPNGQSMYLIHHSKWDIFEWFSCIVFFFNCTSFRQRFILTLFFSQLHFSEICKSDFWYCSWVYIFWMGICIPTCCTTCILDATAAEVRIHCSMYSGERYDLHFPSQYFLSVFLY